MVNKHRCLAFHRGLSKTEWACACGWWHAMPCPQHTKDCPEGEHGLPTERGNWSGALASRTQ